MGDKRALPRVGRETKIKICGLKRPADMEAVNEACPDFAGFVVEYEKSHRSVSRQQLRELTRELRKEVLPVGVFVNAPVRLVAELLEEGTISLAQLHGQEDDAYIRQLQELTEKPLIQAFSVKTAEDVKQARKSPADFILLDQGSGGTGRTFDWSLLSEENGISRQFFLAGGLNVQNLEEAVCRIRPWAVDLSSSLETDGWKDPKKIREAVALVRGLCPARVYEKTERER